MHLQILLNTFLLLFSSGRMKNYLPDAVLPLFWLFVVGVLWFHLYLQLQEALPLFFFFFFCEMPIRILVSTCSLPVLVSFSGFWAWLIEWLTKIFCILLYWLKEPFCISMNLYINMYVPSCKLRVLFTCSCVCLSSTVLDGNYFSVSSLLWSDF